MIFELNTACSSCAAPVGGAVSSLSPDRLYVDDLSLLFALVWFVSSVKCSYYWFCPKLKKTQAAQSSGLLLSVCFRLNRDMGDGAWCPHGQVEPSDTQYLQVRV